MKRWLALSLLLGACASGALSPDDDDASDDSTEEPTADPTPEPPEPPAVLATFPSAGAEGVPVETVLQVVFDQPMTFAGTTTLTPAIAMQRDWSADGRVLMLTPSEPLQYATSYQLRALADHRSQEDLTLESDLVISFSTAEAEPVLELLVDPEHDAQDVDPGTDVAFSWNLPMATVGGEVSLAGTRSGSDLPASTVWTDDRTLTVTPTEPWLPCEDAFVTLGDGFVSQDGLVQPAFTTRFRTAEPLDPTWGFDPADGATGVNTLSELQVSFDQPMDTASQPTVAWNNHSGAAAVAWLDAQTLHISPDVPFEPTTEVTATVAGVRNACGTQLVAESWSFTTNDCAADCPLPVPLAVNSGQLPGQFVPEGSWALYEVDLAEGQIYDFEVTDVAGTAVTLITDPQDCGCDPDLGGPLESRPFSFIPNLDVSMEGVVLEPGQAGTYHWLVGPQVLSGDVAFAVQVSGSPFQCADNLTWTGPVVGQAFGGGVAMQAWQVPQPGSVCTGKSVTVTPAGGDVEVLAVSDPGECNPSVQRSLGTASAGQGSTFTLVTGEHLLVREVGYPTGAGNVTSYDLDIADGPFEGCIDATGGHPWVTVANNTPGFGSTTYTIEVPAGSITTDTFSPPTIAGPCVVLPGSGRRDAVFALQTSGLAWQVDVSTCAASESTIAWVGTALGQGDIASDNGSCGGGCPGLFVAGQAEITGGVYGPGSVLYVHVEQGSQPGADTYWDSDQTIEVVTRVF